MTPDQTKQSRRRLIFIASLFFVPLAIAFVLYYGNVWRPKTINEIGDLITPARPLPQVSFKLANGQQSSSDLFMGKWTWIYIGDGQCDERCRTALLDTRQARLLLNEKMNRVQRVFLTTGNCCDMTFLTNEHRDLIVASLDNPDFTTIFPLYNQVPLPAAGRIYLVDPLGNLMMSYAPNAPKKYLLENIKKLLGLSHIG